MSRVIKLRPWQKEALSLYEKNDKVDFFLVATPGAGKTTFALLSARSQILLNNLNLIVVVPTAHLKIQWSSAAAAIGIQLDTQWTPGSSLVSDFHGVVATYQQVVSNPKGFIRLAGNSFVIIDEIHHAGDDKSWGNALMTAFGRSPKRLLLSGTPFRSDYAAIPFISYKDDMAVPDFEYGYNDALLDGHVVRPIYFPRIAGEMEWSSNDGSVYTATFDDELSVNLSNQRLRTALSAEGDWLREVIHQSHAKLLQIRKHHSDAGGLVVSSDQEHARHIVGLIRKELRLDADLAVSDDNNASLVIERYANSSRHWLVAVKMVSEGIDIPRLRVGVYATTTTTELFFRQVAGRLVRFIPGLGSQSSYLYIPDDPRLRSFAQNIAQSRHHSIKRNDAEEEDDFQLQDDTSEIYDETLGDEFRQLSLFSAIRAVALQEVSTDIVVDHVSIDQEDDPSLVVELTDLPHITERRVGSGGNPAQSHPHSVVQERNKLRKENSALAKMLAFATGLPYAKINSELNKKAGMTTIKEANIRQLEQRIKEAERWLKNI